MLDIISTIVTAIMNAVAKITGKATQDQNKAQAQADVATAKLVSSIKVDQVNSDIKKSTTQIKIPSPSKWNSGAGLIILTLILIGCESDKSTFVHGRMPVIDIPPRPVLEVNDDIWTTREKALVDYAISLEHAIKTYNEYANKSNRDNGYTK